MIRRLPQGIYLYTGTLLPDPNERRRVAAEEFFAAAGLPSRRIFNDERGKPYFEGEGLYLSPTHTQNFYAVAFAPFPVGLDAEKEDTENIRVREKYFSEEEKSLPFSAVWTAKEAVAKILGDGIASLRRIRVFSDGGRAEADGREFSLFSLKEKGLILTLAVPKEET